MTDCFSLIKFTLMKVAVLLSGISGLGINFFVGGYHIASFQKSQLPKHLLMMGLAMSDSITSVYMLGLATADLVMKGEYVLHEKSWRESHACLGLAVAQHLGMLSSLVTLNVISAVYMMAVVWHRKPSSKSIVVVMAMIFSSCIVISCIPVMFQTNIGLHVCAFGTVVLENSSLMIYNIFVHLVLNGVLITLTLTFFMKMMTTIYTTRQSVKRFGSSARKSSSTTYVWLMIQTVCRILCWCPIQAMMLATRCGAEILPELVGWSIIMLMSVNSLINPFIYTIRTMHGKKK